MAEVKICRRKYIRFPVRTNAWWHLGQNWIPVDVLNVSAGGFFCRFPQSLETREKVWLQLQFSDQREAVSCFCRAIHERREGHGQFLVGLAILEIEGMHQVELVMRLKNGEA